MLEIVLIPSTRQIHGFWVSTILGAEPNFMQSENLNFFTHNWKTMHFSENFSISLFKEDTFFQLFSTWECLLLMALYEFCDQILTRYSRWRHLKTWFFFRKRELWETPVENLSLTRNYYICRHRRHLVKSQENLNCLK